MGSGLILGRTRKSLMLFGRLKAINGFSGKTLLKSF